MRRVCLQLFKFSTSEGIKQKQGSSLTTAQQQFSSIPVHLRPYDKSKYQVPLKNIKKNSGYALLQIEPFPRARIMRICYNILQQLKIDIPEDCLDRIYFEQRTKYVMELTDKIQDVQQLQNTFGTDSIQIFIRGLVRNLEYVHLLRKHKLWDIKQTGQNQMFKGIITKHSQKFPIYKKGERPSFKFLDA